jgi:CTP synthase (UTP-ammonia lyase)
MPPLSIAVIGDFDPALAPHTSIAPAVAHAAAALELDAGVEWMATDDLGDYEAADALWCAPGSPYRSMDGALGALRHGRENGVPTLATCGGCQHVIIEYARHVLGFEDAQHAEYDPYASRLFVSELTCSLAGQTLPVRVVAGSLAGELYGAAEVEERYYCNFGLNPEYRGLLENGGLRVSGVDADGEARVLELPGHPYYLATLFVPQTSSTPERPHPLITGLLRAALALDAGHVVRSADRL